MGGYPDIKTGVIPVGTDLKKVNTDPVVYCPYPVFATEIPVNLQIR
jgi:hypothetical protein